MLPAALVWIIEDDRTYRETIAECVAEACRGVDTFESVEEAVLRLDRSARPPADGWPDVVLLDVNLPGISGLEGITEVKRRLPSAAVVMLSIRDDAETVYAALGQGASGYLLKGSDLDQILDALEEARAGGMLMGRHVARLIREAFAEKRPVPDYGLTPREAEVLAEMVAGHSQPTIAEQLFISPSTVNSHVQSIYAKLHVHTGSAAVAKAVRERLVPPSPVSS
ncbi:MAG: response regulator transcription factor [Bacteroidota bacterium]